MVSTDQPRRGRDHRRSQSRASWGSFRQWQRARRCWAHSASASASVAERADRTCVSAVRSAASDLRRCWLMHRAIMRSMPKDCSAFVRFNAAPQPHPYVHIRMNKRFVARSQRLLQPAGSTLGPLRRDVGDRACHRQDAGRLGGDSGPSVGHCRHMTGSSIRLQARATAPAYFC